MLGPHRHHQLVTTRQIDYQRAAAARSSLGYYTATVWQGYCKIIAGMPRG